jgi:pimeloyl-ACP methyl ester carboxylesterase
MIEVTRHFVEVDGRRVHYRTCGSGPPLVLLHGSPGDSTVVEH